MKVGTDGVLLGAWTPLRDSDRRILDIGTGTGLIALMLAQRAPGAAVTGIDIDDVGEARANGDASPWGDRLSFVRCPVQEFSDRPFDLIVSNPPFFVDSLTCPDAGRTTVRHAVHLPFEELRDAVVRLLAADGHFAVVLPTTEADRFVHLCRGTCSPSAAPMSAPRRGAPSSGPFSSSCLPACTLRTRPPARLSATN